MKNNELSSVWQEILKFIKDNIQEPNVIKTFFEPLSLSRYIKSSNTVYIKVPTTFYYEYIEAHYAKLLKSALEKKFGQSVKINYEIPQPVNTKKKNEKMYFPHTDKVPENDPIPVPPNFTDTVKNPFVIPGIRKVQLDPNLNEEMNFNNFVVGPNNEFAHVAAKVVASQPGISYNPLFIYGGSGLGKTHLVQAIGIAIKQKHPDLKVLYVNASTFKDQYSSHVVQNKRLDFLHFYQMMDVLIIDDIQSWESSTGTQAIFFDIFNEMLLKRKQLIFTADKNPAELVKIEERLLSRFRSGLDVEIKSPDFETRLKILKFKTERDGLKIKKEILEYIAQNITTNIREMEGAIMSLQFHAINLKKEITLELAEQVVSKLSSRIQKDVSIDKIKEIVTKYYDLPTDVLNENTRKREIVQARQIAMFLAKKYTKLSLSMIGNKIGKRDHSTVLHACKVVSGYLETDKKFKKDMEEIEKLIKEA
jgi:chromosomal replication initiator protein